MKAVVFVVLGYVAGMLIGVSIDENEPHCPTEDSCTIDYQNGEWHIEEDTP